MSNSNPMQASEVEATITSNIPYQPVTLTVSYEWLSMPKTQTFGTTTDGNGSASVFFNVGPDIAISLTDHVQVSINNGEATCSTSFTVS